MTGDAVTWERHRFPTAKRQWIADALQDAATRAELRWNAPAVLEIRKPNIDALVQWGRANQLDQIAAMRPETGPLLDSLPPLHAALAQTGIRLVLIDRPEDLGIRPLATGGFFQFWERVRKPLAAASTGSECSTPQQLSLDFPW